MEFIDEGQKKKTRKHKKTAAKKSTAEVIAEKNVQETVQQEIAQPITEELTETQQSIFTGGIVLALALLVGILFYNQLQLFELATLAGAPSALQNVASIIPSGSTLALSDGDKVTYGPALLVAGEQPALAGYKTKIKEFPTISASQKKPKTGDIVQDAVNKIVPTGTPEYGAEIGVSFDDPINAMNKFGALESITLTQEQEQRWSKIVNAFTCDYCCGSPQSPTIISRCGCAHAAGWRGLARFALSKYGNKVTDEQVLGEMTKWKALWYPGPTVQRFIQEQSSTNAGGAPVKLDALPQMVGGC